MERTFGQEMDSAFSEAERELGWSAESSDRDSIRDTVASAFESTKAESAVREDFDGASDTRRDVEVRVGNKAHAAVQDFLHFDDVAQRDPAGAAQRLAENYMRLAPHADLKPRPRDYGSNALNDLTMYPEGSTHRRVQEGFRAAKDKAADDGEFTESAETRAAFAKRFPDLTYGQALQRLKDHDEALRQNPLAAAAKIAAVYGMPVTPHQHGMAAVAATRSQHVDQAQGMIDQVISSGVLPGLEHPEVQRAVGKVLDDPRFQRTGDAFTDLVAAYTDAREWLAEQRGQDHAQNARRAAVSIKGGPTGGGGGRSAPSGGSVRDHVRAAWGEAGRL